MSRTYVQWALVSMVGICFWISSGCIAGVHQHEVRGTYQNQGFEGPVEGRVQSIDLGIVADFRYFRLALPFEGQQRELQFFLDEGSVFHRIDEQIENRTLRLDIPFLTIREFGANPSGKWYPGSIRRRHSLDLWLSGSLGLAPINPATAALSLTYYQYSRFAVRLFGGVSFTPYDDVMRAFDGGATSFTPVAGYATGAVFGLEFTLAAGEYGLELFQFFLDYDRTSRELTPNR